MTGCGSGSGKAVTSDWRRSDETASAGLWDDVTKIWTCDRLAVCIPSRPAMLCSSAFRSWDDSCNAKYYGLGGTANVIHYGTVYISIFEIGPIGLQNCVSRAPGGRSRLVLLNADAPGRLVYSAESCSLDQIMACTEAIPLPDSRQKVDELFLFWMSERSTHEILCSELSRVCGLQPGGDEPHLQQYSPSSIISFPRPGSPVRRSPSPPAHPVRSPGNVPNKRTVKSPNQMPPKAISLTEVTGDRPETPKAETAAVPIRTIRRAASESEIPRFYFPNGKPRTETNDKQLREAYKVFQSFPKCEVHYNDFHKVVKVSWETRLEGKGAGCSHVHREFRRSNRTLCKLH